MPLPNLLLVSCKIGKVRPNSESGGARSVRLVFFDRQKPTTPVYAGTVLIVGALHRRHSANCKILDWADFGDELSVVL